MKYKVIMSDLTKDKRIELVVESDNVFDAINTASESIDNPNETELVEAIPLDIR
jgi:hypothetical protein